MTAAYESQFKAQTLAQENAKAPTGRTVPPPGVRAVAGRETAKEQPGPRANTPLRWQVASGLFAEQFGGCFRIVVSGHEKDLPAVLAALTELTK